MEEILASKQRKELLKLDARRKLILAMTVLAAAIFFITFALTFYDIIRMEGETVAFKKEYGGFIVNRMLLAVALSLTILWIAGKLQPAFKRNYKTKVVSRLVQALEPDWNYDAKKHISEEEYINSNLFNQSYEHFGGDDLITGRIGDTEFQCSELHSQNSHRTTDSDGDSKTEWTSVFHGFFFVAGFNKNFKGETYLVHGDLEHKAQTFRGSDRSPGSASRFAKLENKEFSEIFTVKTTDQVEARYILTPSMMEGLVRIYKSIEMPIHISFVDNKVFFAIRLTEDLFEPKLMKSVLNKKEINKITNLLKLNRLLVDELQLNNKLWI